MAHLVFLNRLIQICEIQLLAMKSKMGKFLKIPPPLSFGPPHPHVYPPQSFSEADNGDNGIGSVRLSVHLRTLSCLGAWLCRVQQRAIRVITSPRCLSVCL